MDNKHLEIQIADTYKPITLGRGIVDLTDDLRADDQRRYVSAFIERNGCLLVERIDDGKYVLPRGVITKGETPQDALFRVLRTQYRINVVVGDLDELKETTIPIMHKSDVCYMVKISDDNEIKNLTWVCL